MSSEKDWEKGHSVSITTKERDQEGEQVQALLTWHKSSMGDIKILNIYGFINTKNGLLESCMGNSEAGIPEILNTGGCYPGPA